MPNETPPDGALHPAPSDGRGTNARKPRRPNRVVVLQADVDADGYRNMSVERHGGNVVIRGHDLGAVVTRAFGPGTSEYEWAWRIPAASLPALLTALDGQPGDDPLDAVRRWSEAHPGQDPGRVLKRADVPLEFWNRVGD
jgi:hypothetical protein